MFQTSRSKTMRTKEPTGDEWAVNTLERATRTGQSVYERALARKMDWPKPKPGEKEPIEDLPVYTSIDDAFSTVLQFMSQTTRQCKRYYRSNEDSSLSKPDVHHCDRFHTAKYTAIQHRNPLQGAEDVHVVVAPGNYSVTSGAWGSKQQQTHVVHVDEGQTVDLDFVL